MHSSFRNGRLRCVTMCRYTGFCESSLLLCSHNHVVLDKLQKKTTSSGDNDFLTPEATCSIPSGIIRTIYLGVGGLPS